MSASRLILVFLAGLLALGVITGGCAYSGYNGVIANDEAVKKSWGDVETALQRRFDLIPNLMETVKGYAGHEKEIFVKIAEARANYGKATTVAEKAQSASVLDGYMRSILVQPFPELKANENFRRFMVALEGTENRIKETRTKYNEAVESLNSRIRGFPGSLYAGWAGVKPAEYFKSDEAAKEAPKVKF